MDTIKKSFATPYFKLSIDDPEFADKLINHVADICSGKAWLENSFPIALIIKELLDIYGISNEIVKGYTVKQCKTSSGKIYTVGTCSIWNKIGTKEYDLTKIIHRMIFNIFKKHGKASAEVIESIENEIESTKLSLSKPTILNDDGKDSALNVYEKYLSDPNFWKNMSEKYELWKRTFELKKTIFECVKN